MPLSLKPVLARLGAGETLSVAEAEAAFATIMDGQATQAQIAALLTAMHMRGETVAELMGATKAMRARMTHVRAPADAIDVCGTGGDGVGTLNVSTATAFVVAACGVPVAKHGNRALTSRAGGSDVLAALGVDMDVPPAGLERQLNRYGIAFLFAPRHHPALRHAAPARSEIGFRTLFNLLGPMCNPAGVSRQLTGVYDPAWAAPMAEALGALGTKHAWLVHGQGLDELTLAGATQVSEWYRGELRQFLVTPAQAGLPTAPIEAIRGGDAAENAAALRALVEGAPGAYRDTVLLNAAAALIVAGRAADLREGAGLAASALDRGAALDVLESLVRDATEEAGPRDA
jgi:anthranilate phosphoribosyltransferase/anthranilate synthase/phosphoribosyltransferase